MTIIGERIIAYLKTDATLVALIGSNTNIFPMNVPLRKDKYITVATNVGKDGNNIPSDIGEIMVEIIVSRTVANAHKICFDIAKRVDDLLNKHENLISNGSYTILNFVRDSSSGLQVDDTNNEFYIDISYAYIQQTET